MSTDSLALLEEMFAEDIKPAVLFDSDELKRDRSINIASNLRVASVRQKVAVPARRIKVNGLGKCQFIEQKLLENVHALASIANQVLELYPGSDMSKTLNTIYTYRTWLRKLGKKAGWIKNE